MRHKRMHAECLLCSCSRQAHIRLVCALSASTAAEMALLLPRASSQVKLVMGAAAEPNEALASKKTGLKPSASPMQGLVTNVGPSSTAEGAGQSVHDATALVVFPANALQQGTAAAGQRGRGDDAGGASMCAAERAHACMHAQHTHRLPRKLMSVVCVGASSSASVPQTRVGAF